MKETATKEREMLSEREIQNQRMYAMKLGLDEFNRRIEVMFPPQPKPQPKPEPTQADLDAAYQRLLAKKQSR